MNKQLIWNFEFSPQIKPYEAPLLNDESSDLKWEARAFWRGNQQVILNATDEALFDLNHYKHKHRDDYYYLIPDAPYNIKRRNKGLYYKPVQQQLPQATGFGAKIEFSNTPKEATEISPDLYKILSNIERYSIGISVTKEAYIYKFPTEPTIKLELAQLEVLNKTYLSLCIEGKSAVLVENFFKHLLGSHISCDYVTFLKNILKS